MGILSLFSGRKKSGKRTVASPDSADLEGLSFASLSEWNLSSELMMDMKIQRNEAADFMGDPSNWSAGGRESAF